MSSYEKVRKDLDGNFDQLPESMEVLWNRAKLEEAILIYKGKGFCYPITFTTHEDLVVTDPNYSGPKFGRMVTDHIFFFEGAMSESWARDIATTFQSLHGKYIGLEETYFGQESSASRTLVTQSFSPEELSAWMRLYWDWNSIVSFVPRDPENFLCMHGSEKENYL